MSRLEELVPDVAVRGILPDSVVTVINVQWHTEDVVTLTFRSPTGLLDDEVLYRDSETRIEVVDQGRPWSFDGDGRLLRLVSEANRIQLAHLFDPLLAVHTSEVDPLPHQITAVYESMIDRQPLRFLLADDPGAGKTIMAGLLVKELIARGDVKRCLVVCPGNLVEQWQDEMYERFGLPFDILTNDKLETARTGNWFLETELAIGRLDKLARDESVQDKLAAPDCRWDLIICDEAHKMSATFFGGEISYTKRYHLGRFLSNLTRHFLLMTATPHNGKEEDFQLFMALLDGDRFEGRFRGGAQTVDVSDLMRRVTKEELVKFDNTPLLPERIAETVAYFLSDQEKKLYEDVTDYVRKEFNRAAALQNNKRAGNIGFALTILQRRLASSPEAIYRSLRRRRARLESTLVELQSIHNDTTVKRTLETTSFVLDDDDFEDHEDAPEDEVEVTEGKLLDRATAAGTIHELSAEISTLERLETAAFQVRANGGDKKWEELAALFSSDVIANQKLVIFTEYRDTLRYLVNRISDLLGNRNAIVSIHGSMRREDRARAQELFKLDPEVLVLVATDAAGEGINLQRAHLMVNYDLPWNPNRIEQRFGRIHRIGQTEVCRLWNLVASGTREGDVYHRLLSKLEQARSALGGKVFDVLGKMHFDGKPLRELLIQAIRYGEREDIRGKLDQVVDNAFDHTYLQSLWEEKALATDSMDTSRLHKVREQMERAEASRLQPHFIESFFIEAFRTLGGSVIEREQRRYAVSRVPATLRNRDKSILPRYDRIVFEKDLKMTRNQPLAAFICPGNPLLDQTATLLLENNRDLMRRGAVLVDENDVGTLPRLLFYLDHSIRDATRNDFGDRRVVSRRMLYVELDGNGNSWHPQYAPYLDYRPLKDCEPDAEAILNRHECGWLTRNMEQKATSYAIENVVPGHFNEVTDRRLEHIEKTQQAVSERLTNEIDYWAQRSENLKVEELTGKINARLNSNEARRRSDELRQRLRDRTAELELEKQISPSSPVILGNVLVVPIGLIADMTGDIAVTTTATDKQAVASDARRIVMGVERDLGFEPVDREKEKLGYDVESRVTGQGKLRFIEVKGRASGAATLTVTRNEILYSLNKPEDFILAMVEFLPDGTHRTRYLRQPFNSEPDFGVTSVNYDFAELLARSEEPN